MSCPVRASAQATAELEFHISPAPSSSRPHVRVGISENSEDCPDSLRILGVPQGAVHSYGDVWDTAPGPAPRSTPATQRTQMPLSGARSCR